MNLVIDRAADLRPATPVVWQTSQEHRWRRALAQAWREAMENWAMLARYRIVPGVFW